MKKHTMKKAAAGFLTAAVTLTAAAPALLASASEAAPAVPKYVFLFIGDGMSYPQIQATADYLGAVEQGGEGDILQGPKKLAMMEFPVAGSATTFDSTSFCPDSASTATSISTGSVSYTHLDVYKRQGMWYQIEEQEEAVVVTLGEAKAVSEKGLHFKLPLIQQVHKVNTTIQGFPIGYDTATNETVDDEAVMITSDYNFINADFFVEYRISDPVKYLYASDSPEDILKNIAQSCIRTVIASYDVDSVLTTGKSEIQAAIKEMILDKLETQDIGLDLVNITIQDSEPPTQEIMQAFKAVETAKQGKDTALNNANKYRNEKLPAAKAQADEIVQDAEAKKQTRINEAEAQVARFNAM